MPTNSTATRTLPATPSHDSRTIPVTCKLSPADLAVLEPKASKAGKTMSSFLREAGLSSTVQPVTVLPTVNRDQWRELSKVAANLNQLAHHCNLGMDDPRTDKALALMETMQGQLAEVRSSLLGHKKGPAL